MVASIKPHRDELGLGDGRMLIDGDWVASADEATWSHLHPATEEQVLILSTCSTNGFASAALPMRHETRDARCQSHRTMYGSKRWFTAFT